MAVLLALVAASFAGSALVEARSGQFGPGGSTAGEAELDLALEAADHGPDAGVRVGYTPRLVVGKSTDALHRGHAAVDFRFSRGTSVELSADGSLGRVDLSPLTSGTTVTPVAQLPVRFVEVATAGAALNAQQRISPRLAWSAGASYAWGGSIDAGTHGLVPRTRQPGATLRGDFAWTRLDSLSLGVDGRLSSADNGSTSSVANAAASLTHTFSRDTKGRLALGAGWTETRLSPLAPSVWGLLPTAEASLTSAEPIRGQQLSGSLRGLLAPALDTLTGTAYTRAELSADGAWALTRTLEVTLHGAFAQVVQGVLDGTRTVQGEAALRVPVSRDLRLSGVVRAADVRQRGPALSLDGFQWTALLQLQLIFATRT